MKPITLRIFEDGDRVLFETWVNTDYIKKWYLKPEAWLEEIDGRKNQFFWISHFIVTCGGKPIGFCQYYDCFHANEMES